MRTGRYQPSSGLRTAIIILLGTATFSARVDAQLVINEILADNKRTLLDDDRESSDWVELLNTSATAINVGDFSISDDPQMPMKWRFPEAELGPGEFLLVWCSGKNRTMPSRSELTARDSTIPFTPTILDLDRPWRYLVGQPEDLGPPADWADPDFDDSNWPTGLPGFGFGDDDDTTVLPEDIGAVFLRTEIEITDPTELDNLVLNVSFDDGFVVFLNGQRVLDVNYTVEEDPTFASRSSRSHEARFPQRFDINDWIERLRPGENTIGVVVLNRTISSADLSFAPQIGTVPPVFHTSFRLDNDGDFVLLFSTTANDFVDAVEYPEQVEDHSYGRPPTTPDEFAYLLFPTPREVNDDHASGEPIPEFVEFSPRAGLHNGPVDVVLSANMPFEDAVIRYTTTGADPMPSSTLYDGPIRVSTNRVIRANVFLDDRPVLKAASRSYFTRADALVLPRISISMNPQVFNQLHNAGDARGRASEREGFIEVFDALGNLGTATGFGLRLHGGAGRGGGITTKKAYKAYFRGEYGDTRLRLAMIPDTPVDSFDKLVLRSNFNDAFRTGAAAAFIRDQVIRDLHEDMGALVSHGSWNNLYVNMRYRGVYNVVERMDGKFLASYFPEDGENWDVIKTSNDVLDGDSREWNRMLTFFRNNNLSNDELYDQAVDLGDYTAYMLLNIWAQNHDWPHNNWYAARPRREDGKWIFLSWDAEFGLGRSPTGYSSDTLNHVLGRSTSSLGLIVTNLLANPRYGQYLLEKTDEYTRGPLSPENALAHVRRQAALIDPDVPEECAITSNNYNQWRNNIRAVETFAQRRTQIFRGHIFNSSRIRVPRTSRTDPRQVTLFETNRVRLIGFGFSSTMEIEIAGHPAIIDDFVSSRVVDIILPATVDIAGFPTISTRDANGLGFTARDLLEVTYEGPSVDLIAPPHGSESGGDTVQIFGMGFTEGAGVEFGGVPAPSVELVGDSGQVLRVVTPPGEGVVDVVVYNSRPVRLEAVGSIQFTYDPDDVVAFLRGDCDANGRLSISDAVCVLRNLFAGAGDLPCENSADADDDGTVGLTDAVNVLDFLFRQGATPPPPFPECGIDRTADPLTCVTAACR